MELDELIEKAKQQDEYATTELFKMTYKKAYIEALSFMKDEDKASDALQIAYINIFKNIDKLEDSKTFYKWVNTIVANTCKNELKKRKEFTFSDYDESSDEGLTMEVEDEKRDYKPEENINYEEDRDVVIGFINELPTEQKAALVLQVYEDMKISEIADIFDTSENTIKSRLNYAKKSLKDKITEYKEKGHTLFAMPLVPYIQGILKAYEETLFIDEEAGKGILGFLGIGAGAAGKARQSGNNKTDKNKTKAHKTVTHASEKAVRKGIIGTISTLSTATKTIIVAVIVLAIGTGTIILTSTSPSSDDLTDHNNNELVTNLNDTQAASIIEANLEESEETYIKYLVECLSYDEGKNDFYTHFTQNVDNYSHLLSFDTLKALYETGLTEKLKMNEEDATCEDPLDSHYISQSIGTIKNQETVDLKAMPEINKDIIITATDYDDEYKVYYHLENHDYCEALIKREENSFFGYTVLEYTIDDQRYIFNEYNPSLTSSAGPTTSINSEEQACRYVFENDFAIDYDEVKDNQESNTVKVTSNGSTEDYGQYYQIEVNWEQGNIYIYYVFTDSGKIICLTDTENDLSDIKSETIDSHFDAVNVIVSQY